MTSATQSFTATLNLAHVEERTGGDGDGDRPNNGTRLRDGGDTRSPFVVTNTDDNVPGSEVGSLRQAILDANASPAVDRSRSTSRARPRS